MSRKLTYEFVKESFEKEGYTLLSTEYICANKKLDYVCPNEHKHSISWNNWQQGKRCYFCFGSEKHTIDYIKLCFEKEGYTLLSNEYINNSTKLDYICPKGHKHNITFGNWISGYRCPTCANIINGTRQRKRVFDIKVALRDDDYTLLSVKYSLTGRTVLKCKCPIGHVYEVRWNCWQQGQRCPTCRGIKMSIDRSGPNHPNWKGGISCDPYCDAWSDKEYKNDIKNRDGNMCLNPECWKKDNILSIHHIDYNKKNCSPNNLITVCRSCNSRANKDRKWHTSWYQAVIKNRYITLGAEYG